MADIETRVQELAELMDEFQLSEAELEGDGWKVGFRRHRAPNPGVHHAAPAFEESYGHDGDSQVHDSPPPVATLAVPVPPAGEPLESPMNGIYYSAPSPTAPPFCKEGEEVEEGQVLALIEAMKVFNEIVAPHSGRVTRIMTTNGQLVQTGDVMLYLEANG